MDQNCGAYSCMTKGCVFVVHNNCATQGNVWDGKELEGEPEETESIKPPFEEISDGIIRHFSHLEYPMLLNEDIQTLYDEKKLCQACMLPICIGKAYTCMRIGCDYVLHEACAYLPRVIQHPLHIHSLTLEPSYTQTNRICQLCFRDSFGFKYMCYIGCHKLSLDVRCASISDQYNYHSHKHPLFITTDFDDCLICGEAPLATLNCDKCQYFLCFRCATLPYRTRYKNDEHLVTISYGKYADGYHWCDLCEETISPNKGFYRCNECEISLHIECLLGCDLYMNPTSRITLEGDEFEVIQNDASTRPICSGCQRRCQYKMMFIASSGHIYCSVRDIYTYNLKRYDQRISYLTLAAE